MRPVIFLDIDGVVNVIPPRRGNHPHKKVWKDWETTEILTYPITYSPELIAHLNRLSEHADIIWLTTWREEAVKDFAPAVGLREFEFINPEGAEHPSGSPYFNGDGAAGKRWWKLNGVLDHITTTGTPFVWVDDELRSKTKKFVKGLAEDCDIPNLIFMPFETKGLEPEHIARMDEFVARFKDN